MTTVYPGAAPLRACGALELAFRSRDRRGACDPGRMEQRISLVTLGVRDLARARAFYESMGWTGAVQPDDEVVFFHAGGMILSLWKRERLVDDARLPDAGGFGAVALALNVRSTEEVRGNNRGGAWVMRR